MKWYHAVGLGFLGLLLTLGWILTGRRTPNPADTLSREAAAIDAAADAKKAQAELGTEKALQAIKERYRSDITLMDAAKRERAKKLEKDPAALARFIVRGRA